MNFIDKLIEETENGELDFIWEYVVQGNKFKYKAEKHPLTDLNFSPDDIVTKEEKTDSGKIKVVPDTTKGRIIFPNGASLTVDKGKLDLLYSLCNDAVLRAMGQIASDYGGGTIQADIAEAKARKEAEKKKSKNKKDVLTDEE